MADHFGNELNPAAGQLWQNVRTGDVLFLYARDGQIEGVFGDGRKKNDLEVIAIGDLSDGWKCIFNRCTSDVFGTDQDTYEYRAL